MVFGTTWSLPKRRLRSPVHGNRMFNVCFVGSHFFSNFEDETRKENCRTAETGDGYVYMFVGEQLKGTV